MKVDRERYREHDRGCAGILLWTLIGALLWGILYFIFWGRA